MVRSTVTLRLSKCCARGSSSTVIANGVWQSPIYRELLHRGVAVTLSVVEVLCGGFTTKPSLRAERGNPLLTETCKRSAVTLRLSKCCASGLGSISVSMNYSRPLITAGATSFVLKQKDQKFKTEKTFCPQVQLPARFSVGHLRAWMVDIFFQLS